MTSAGQLARRVTFKRRALDANGDRLGDYTDIVTRDARVQSLKGGEGVQQQRMEGQQPVIITVRRDIATKAIDNSYESEDARDATLGWDIQSVIVTEDLMWVEILALQRRGQAVP